jgi:hypothetical protein
MKIYKNEEECRSEAEAFCEANKIDKDRIEEGSYKGGLYDCLFILSETNGKPIFEGAY